MKTSSEGFQQSYNAQMVVEGENQLVVGAEVTDNASDQGQLIPMVDAAAEMCGETPAQVLADAGYCNERDLQALKERDIDGYVALGREGGTAAAVRTSIRRRRAWPRSWRATRAGGGTHAESGWRRRRSAGSRR